MKRIIYFCTLLTVVFTFTNCKSDDEEKVEPELESKASYYFEGTLNGEEISFEESLTYGNGSGTRQSGLEYYAVTSTFTNINGYYTSDTSAKAGGVEVAFIASLKDETTSYNTEMDFQSSLIENRSYEYATELDYHRKIEFYYYDENQVSWSTVEGNQEGSTFEVVELIDNTDGYSVKVFTANFSCTLYNEKGESKKLTNGVFRGRVVSLF